MWVNVGIVACFELVLGLTLGLIWSFDLCFRVALT